MEVRESGSKKNCSNTQSMYSYSCGHDSGYWRGNEKQKKEIRKGNYIRCVIDFKYCHDHAVIGKKKSQPFSLVSINWSQSKRKSICVVHFVHNIMR